MSFMEALMDMYAAVWDQESVQEINKELETLKKGCTSAKNRALEELDSRAHEELSASSGCSPAKSTRRSMSKMKEGRIEQWLFKNAERRNNLGELEKRTEAIKASKTILDSRIIKEKEEQILK